MGPSDLRIGAAYRDCNSHAATLPSPGQQHISGCSHLQDNNNIADPATKSLNLCSSTNIHLCNHKEALLCTTQGGQMLVRPSWASFASKLRNQHIPIPIIRNKRKLTYRSNRSPLKGTQPTISRAFSSSSIPLQSIITSNTTSTQDLRAYAEAIHHVYAAKMDSGRLSNLDVMQIADR